jgi:glycosyltransferase involved in cell wall biosynthesis
MKIIHIAPLNTSGVPISLVQAEKDLGYESRLVTFAPDHREYTEDICLNLPFLDFAGTRLVKRLVSDPGKLRVDNSFKIPDRIPLQWRANNRAEALLVSLRELIWTPRFKKFFDQIDFWNFDVYQLDGGLGFYRDGRVIEELKKRGKRIICCYTGSDLRTRGVIPAIDAVADLNVTLEFDHLKLHPNIHHVGFPFDSGRFEPKPGTGNHEVVRIGHSPTNRLAKGSDHIIRAINSLKARYPVELVLIENVSYEESLRLKAGCDIFVDQLGDLGYGLSALEALAMGIATCSCLVDGFEDTYPDHPIVEVSALDLEGKLVELLENPDKRIEIGRKGHEWVKRVHGKSNVVKKIHELAGLRAGDDAAPGGRPLAVDVNRAAMSM